ncbi:hypothetical protein [Paenibacillus agricola]|uniref:Uncharacterized protein n=1 Tax=Paenibacillus agricola TaxID=2716264 RepID=A0ABX0JJN3_9BACL|nr:hypothetical protein [Paenibacillus agricola]NHN35008.1 hypothetical protein [Paenibacillus agricola]
MQQTVVLFNERTVPVQFLGSNEKQIPALLSALKQSKLTVSRMEEPSLIELYGSEAIVHTVNGDRYRLPVF